MGRYEPGRVRYEPERADLELYRAQAADAHPLGLQRLLVRGHTPLAAGPEERFRRESYTLTRYLFLGEEGRLRPRWIAYLRSASLGRGGPGNLLEALESDAQSLEQAWREDVLRTAGH